MPNPGKLRSLLGQRGMTQKELAEQIETTEQNVSRMVNGGINATENTIKKICEVLKCTPNDII